MSYIHHQIPWESLLKNDEILDCGELILRISQKDHIPLPPAAQYVNNHYWPTINFAIVNGDLVKQSNNEVSVSNRTPPEEDLQYQEMDIWNIQARVYVEIEDVGMNPYFRTYANSKDNANRILKTNLNNLTVKIKNTEKVD